MVWLNDLEVAWSMDERAPEINTVVFSQTAREAKDVF